MKIAYHNSICSDEDKRLKDLIVSFKVSYDGLLTIEQVEKDCFFTGFPEIFTLNLLGKSAIARLEEICMDYYNNYLKEEKEFNPEAYLE